MEWKSNGCQNVAEIKARTHEQIHAKICTDKDKENHENRVFMKCKNMQIHRKDNRI